MTWAAFIALVMRCTQSAIPARRAVAPHKAPEAARLNCYVDDPVGVICGDRADRRRTVVLIVVIWLCLGLPLAFSKGQHSAVIVWIGSQIAAERRRVG